MEILGVLMEFAGILTESRKLFLKNRKVMLFVVLFTLLLHSLIFLFNVFSVKPFIADLVSKSTVLLVTSPNTLEYAGLLLGMLGDLRFFIGSESAFFILFSITSIFVTIALVHASALTYSDRNVSIKDLMLFARKSWRGPFVTCFYVTLFNLGYFFLLLLTLFPVALFAQSSFVLRAISLILTVLATAFESYLAIVWNLSVVVSIVEEIYGIEAFGKAARIAKGTKLHVFLLNCLCAVVYWVLVQGLMLVDLKQPLSLQIFVWLLVWDTILLVRMFVQVAYTVFYFNCKKNHGEEVELQGEVEYVKITPSPLIGENVP